ncbi:MAG TPA: pyruvate dehydrogenase (acetyl-transferring) E1 component subunit alpha [Actinomycetota bacterium]|nr:pyruvate dehydrogenase (acetyl-transferring) E1 component subunit alpha [Actinomycetota bacterium]
MTDDTVRILNPDGGVDPQARQALDLKDEDLLELYRSMVLTRNVDLECTALQRQGELAVYPPAIGQEAAQVGSAFALGDQDMVYPSYREVGVAIVRGLDIVEYMHFHRGTWHGGVDDPVDRQFGMISVPVGSQTLHATGHAMGTKLDGKDVVTITYFGDGATSQGDVHEAMNFAGVFGAPVVFFCQNNQWAISVPLERQTAGEIYRKAEGYGFPGVRVDGNDVLAVYRVTREAVERARNEHQPTLIEAVTYRMGPHSTADDATRYREKADVDRWQELDPIARYRTFLEAEGIADQSFFLEAEADGKELAATVRAGIQGAPPRQVEDLFRWVFADLPPHLARQEEEMLRLAKEEEDG